MRTATITNYLIESTPSGVALNELRRGAWITIQLGINFDVAARYGFDLSSPAVQAVFADADLLSRS